MAWLQDLQWQEHDGCASFLELALDFEAHLGRAMPAAQGHDLQGISLSLHERGRVLRSALAVLEKHVVQGVVAPGPMVVCCRSLVPMGAGLMAGLRCRPYFTQRDEMIRQLDGLWGYCKRRMVARQPKQRPSQHLGAADRPLQGRAACPADRSQSAGSNRPKAPKGPKVFRAREAPTGPGPLQWTMSLGQQGSREQHCHLPAWCRRSEPFRRGRRCSSVRSMACHPAMPVRRGIWAHAIAAGQDTMQQLILAAHVHLDVYPTNCHPV